MTNPALATIFANLDATAILGYPIFRDKERREL